MDAEKHSEDREVCKHRKSRCAVNNTNKNVTSAISAADMSSHRNVTRMLLILSMSVCFCTATLVDGPWSNMKDLPEQRAKALLMNMTQTEKLSMLHGPQYGPCCSCTQNSSCAYVGNINAIDRLGIPPTTMNDGPQGFRDNVHPGTTTAWPSGLSMAASWDVDAMLEWGTGMLQHRDNSTLVHFRYIPDAHLTCPNPTLTHP